jgi:hypothetical protein
MSAIPTLSLSLSFPVLYAFFFAVTVAHRFWVKKGEKRRQEEIFRFRHTFDSERQHAHQNTTKEKERERHQRRVIKK